MWVRWIDETCADFTNGQLYQCVAVKFVANKYLFFCVIGQNGATIAISASFTVPKSSQNSMRNLVDTQLEG